MLREGFPYLKKRQRRQLWIVGHRRSRKRICRITIKLPGSCFIQQTEPSHSRSEKGEATREARGAQQVKKGDMHNMCTAQPSNHFVEITVIASFCDRTPLLKQSVIFSKLILAVDTHRFALEQSFLRALCIHMRCKWHLFKCEVVSLYNLPLITLGSPEPFARGHQRCLKIFSCFAAARAACLISIWLG